VTSTLRSCAIAGTTMASATAIAARVRQSFMTSPLKKIRRESPPESACHCK
jgi:hypothetical protein